MPELENRATTTRVLTLTQFCGVTPRLFEALMRRFRTLDAVFAASRSSLLDFEGLPRAQADRIARASERLAEAEAMVESLAARDIALVTRFDDAYGHLLFELNDPPSLLYVRGSG